MNRQPLRLSPEMLVPRLGDYLVQKDFITEDDLIKALAYQQNQLERGRACLLGQALVEQKLLPREKLDQVVTEQILQLRNALQAANRSLEERVQQRTAELEQALVRLSDLSQVKTNFVSNISHELRTPLTHIKGYVELLISESLGPISADQKHALQVSQQSTERLEALINDLIMFSLASRGELTLNQEAVDLSRLLHPLMKAVQQKAVERGVTAHALIDDGLPMVQADPQKLTWALSQLLDNAVKFTPSAGRVILRVHRESGELVMISVVDTGIGIAAGQLEEIFEPFHQLDASSTRKYQGTGIGLSLVRQIVEAHGSMLDVVSAEGKGSTFRFPLLTITAKNPKR